MIADRRDLQRLTRWAGHMAILSGEDAPDEWPPPCAIRPARSGPGGPGGEVELWRAIREADGGPPAHVGGIDLAASGPLWPSSEWAAIEVWTEAELCGLHGLWRATAMGGPRAEALASRLLAACSWHLEHTQPDNATNRPWAAHVFLLDGRAEAQLYAETLVHNAQAQGNADPASRWILADAARSLRRAIALAEQAERAG